MKELITKIAALLIGIILGSFILGIFMPIEEVLREQNISSYLSFGVLCIIFLEIKKIKSKLGIKE